MQLLEVLTQSYRKAGVLKAAGRGLSGSEQDEALHLVNSHLDGLKTEFCFVYQMIRTVVNIVAYQQDYIVGSAATLAQYGITPDWDIEKPERLYGAGWLSPQPPGNNPAEIPMRNILDYSKWKSIVCKQVQSSQVTVIYYRPGLQDNNPVAGTASVWPVPYTDSQIVIYTPGLVSEFTDINQDVLWPQGYREFMEFDMACVVNANYPNAVMKPMVPMLAKQYKARVMANQVRPLFIGSDPAAMPIRSGVGLSYWGAREWPGGDY